MFLLAMLFPHDDQLRCGIMMKTPGCAKSLSGFAIAGTIHHHQNPSSPLTPRPACVPTGVHLRQANMSWHTVCCKAMAFCVDKSMSSLAIAHRICASITEAAGSMQTVCGGDLSYDLSQTCNAAVHANSILSRLVTGHEYCAARKGQCSKVVQWMRP